MPTADDATPAGPRGTERARAPGPPARVPGRVLLFMTTQAALRAEDELLGADVEVDVVPKPEGMRGLCGIALGVPAAELTRASSVLEAAGVPFEVYDEGDVLA